MVGDIEFRNVYFRYPSRPTLRILRSFALNCAPSSTTALVGPSGSGKSTTVALLQRFYDPLKGKILLDGHDIKVLNIRWLRSLVGLVQQEPILFNLSIRDNIAYGDNSREVTQSEIEAAARRANIHELIISLPSVRCSSFSSSVIASLAVRFRATIPRAERKEVNCPVVKNNAVSSGSEVPTLESTTRNFFAVAIARALVRSPKILLLDEATSALDNNSEKVVQAALDKARSGRTCLTIAHRLSTIQNCEKIAVVDRGKLKEEVRIIAWIFPMERAVLCSLSGHSRCFVGTGWSLR